MSEEIERKRRKGIFTKEDKFGDTIPRIGPIVGIVAIIVILFIAVLTMTVIIGAGEAGVKFDMLKDGVQPDEFTEGFHFKAPWVSVDRYNIKTQDYTMSKIVEEGQTKRDDRIRTVTKGGLYVDLDITVLYRIDATKADVIRKSIGIDGQYQEIVVRPTVRNAVREVISSYEAMDIYGDKRSEVEMRIYNTIAEQLNPRNILVERMLLRDVGLPEQLTKAIETKKTAEQDALKMEYILDKERMEKDRKIIEAGGISEANKIIAGSLTKEYLTWYWIDNLHTHESVIYVPVGDGGMPMFREIS